MTPPPPGIDFTFTNTPSVDVAEVGNTVEYRYCGTNTSDVDLEVVRVVDDRFGVLQVPEDNTVVSPGETLCTVPVDYTVQPSDEGTTIVSNAVVTVRTTGVDAQSFEAADSASVDVAPKPMPDTGPRGLSTQLYLAALALVVGSGLILAGRRRSS